MMRRGAIKVSGGIGALPAWIEYGKGMIDLLKYKDQVDELDISIVKRGEWPIKYDARLASLNVDLPRGIVFSGSEGGEEVFGTTNLDKTGESFENEFAVGNTVRGVIRAPGDGKGGVARFYSPFAFKPEMREAGTSSVSTQVEVLDKAASGPDQSEGPANAGLLPGLKPGELGREDDQVLDDDGRVIKGDELSAPGATPGTARPSTLPSGVITGPNDPRGPGKSDSEQTGGPDQGDLW
jgi:hypothetical protein